MALREEPLEFNPMLPEYRADPYPFYHRFRQVDPVHWSDFLGFWVLTRYADIVAVLRDPRFSANPGLWEGYQDFLQSIGGRGPLSAMEEKWMLFMDPPDHTRLRTLVGKAFTPRVVEGLRPHIREVVADLLKAAEAKGAMDLIADLAYPLPVIVIAEMLGVPTEDRDLFKGWSRDLARTLDPVVTPEIIARGNEATLAFMDYFRHLIARRRREPREDLMSALIAAEEGGERLNEEELLATCVLLFGAGHETTMNLIGNGMLALLRHPAELKKLREHPSLIQSAVEELLRYDGPVQITARVAMEDVEVGGKTVRKGQQVLLVLGAANRDPAQFSDPDRLDLGRSENRPLAFGHGIHFCLGAPLARVEAQMAIGMLLDRFPTLRLASTALEWRDTVTLRGLKALPLVF